MLPFHLQLLSMKTLSAVNGGKVRPLGKSSQISGLSLILKRQVHMVARRDKL